MEMEGRKGESKSEIKTVTSEKRRVVSFIVLTGAVYRQKESRDCRTLHLPGIDNSPTDDSKIGGLVTNRQRCLILGGGGGGGGGGF
jgi:hypothetical protein